MRVRCMSNTGVGFSEYTMNHMGCSINTKLPLRVNETYTVYGQMLYKRILKYLIKGSDENLPSWYPAEIFEIVDSQLPFDWHFRYCSDDKISAVWGFQELVEDDQYLDNLIERKDEAVRTFLKRKKEIDEFAE